MNTNLMHRTATHTDDFPFSRMQGTNRKSEPVQSKIVLRATKLTVKKTGMNSGITGGGYQCC